MVTSSFAGAALGVSQARAPMRGHLLLGLTCLALGQAKRHVMLGLACPCLGVSQTCSPTWGYLALGLPYLGRTAGLACHMARSDTWAALPMHWVRPDVALRPQIIIFFSINTFNDNKNNNLCTTNNNLFNTNTLNSNENKYYYFQL